MAITEEIEQAGVGRELAQKAWVKALSKKRGEPLEGGIEPFHPAKGRTDEVSIREFSKIAVGLVGVGGDEVKRYRQAASLIWQMAAFGRMHPSLQVYFREDTTDWIKRVQGRRKGKVELRIRTDALAEPYRSRALALQEERRNTGRKAYFGEGIMKIRVSCSTKKALESLGNVFGIPSPRLVEGIGKLVEEKAISIVEEKGRFFLWVMEARTELGVKNK